MPRLLSTCSKIVYKSFRRFEKSFDRINRIVGPVFVSIAVLAIGGCAFAFFDVVFPEEFLGEETSWAYSIFGTLWCGYLVAMFTFHVCTLSLLRDVLELSRLIPYAS
jgi:hypothetical protein